MPILFLGRYYKFAAPWYYAIFMTLVTVPIFTLLLFALGLVRLLAQRGRDPLALLALINFLFFMALMLAPLAPTYDGVRLFAPALVFLALLAGFGFDGALNWAAKRMPDSRKKLAQALALAALAIISVIPLARVYPNCLEYYNGLIGGSAGALRRGMETTYWWTVVNDTDVRKIDGQLPAGSTLLCWPRPRISANSIRNSAGWGWTKRSLPPRILISCLCFQGRFRSLSPFSIKTTFRATSLRWLIRKLWRGCRSGSFTKGNRNNGRSGPALHDRIHFPE